MSTDLELLFINVSCIFLEIIRYYITLFNHLTNYCHYPIQYAKHAQRSHRRFFSRI